jgi:hypothetical protein
MKRTMISLLSLIPLTFAACGGDSSSSGDCKASGGTNKAQYVTNAVMVPEQRSDFAIDLNGDGRVDNQLGNIIGALEGQMLHVQDGVNQAVTDGTLIVLMSETSSDSTFQTDSCATAQVQVGQPIVAPATPDYSGSGHFTVDSAQMGGTFNGPIKVGKFSSAPPATTKTPVEVDIKLPLIAGADPVTLKVNGAHLQFTRDSSGKITGGQLNGAIKNSDVQTLIIPNVAMLLTKKIADDMAAGPLSSGDMQILSIFDNGGKADASCSAGTCKNPDGSCATKGDNKIDICEVSTAGLIQNVLAPDVQMFQNGQYKPSKDNTMKDSLSLGLAFTAVGASF